MTKELEKKIEILRNKEFFWRQKKNMVTDVLCVIHNAVFPPKEKLRFIFKL